MKKYIPFVMLLIIFCFIVGCESTVDNSGQNYQNRQTKKPLESDSFDGYNTPLSTSNPENEDDNIDSDGVDKTDNTKVPDNTDKNNDYVTKKPSISTDTPLDVEQNKETNSPEPTGANTPDVNLSPSPSSTSKPTVYPTVSPTSPPVITQGPKEYFVLTVYNGGGGGYVYINQGVDTDTGIEGATNVDKGWFAAGSYASISAVPYEGCTFDGWYVGDDFVSPEADYTFVMPERDYPLTARFIF